MIFLYKTRDCTVTCQNDIVLKKALPSRLETNLSKLNILDLTEFVSEYTTVGSSNLISVGWHAFTDES